MLLSILTHEGLKNMKTVLAESVIQLEQFLETAQPTVISTRPFVGEKRILLEMKGAEFLEIVSSSRGKKEIRPYYFSGMNEVRSCFFLIARCGGNFRALFCLSHQGVSSSLVGEGEQCVLQLKGEAITAVPVLICVHGSNLHQTIGLAVRLGIKLVSHSGKLREEKPPIHQWMGSLGWESGGAFGGEPSHDKVISAVWGLRQAGIQPGYVLIDDGWQDTAANGNGELLLSFEANRKRFPMGLSGLVKELQRAGVHHVGVAHPILGAKGGISEGLAEMYQVMPLRNRRRLLGSDLGKTFQFYHDYYQYLSEQGISFTKVKHQTDVEKYAEDSAQASSLFHHLQSAIQAASSLHFDAPHLNSECICSENIFYWTTSRLACTADDLDKQSLQGAKKAIRNVLANSLWMQHLMNPDFNAWATDFPQSRLLAMMHALSGTINVISDPPGKSNVELLKKCVLPSGKLIQTDYPLTLCNESAFFNPLTESSLYRGFSFKGEAGILALFNLSRRKKPIQQTVSPQEVEGIVGDRFAVYSHVNGFMGVVAKEESFPVSIKQHEADILTFAPIRNGIALIGCYAFFLPPGPIQEVTLEDDSMHITSIVTSPLLMYSEREVMEIRRNGESVPWDYDETKKLLVIDSRQSQRETPTVYTISFI